MGVAAAVVSASMSASGADWPRYHFDNQNTAYSPTETLTFPLYLKWTFSTGGAWTNPPMVVGPNVYFSAGNTPYAIDRANAATVWTYTTGGGVTTPTIAPSGLLYTVSDDLNVYCLNASNGAFVWSYGTTGTYGTTPLVEAGSVFTSTNPNTVYRVNSATGALVWTYFANGVPNSVISTDGSFIFFSTNNDIRYAVDRASGTLVWSYVMGAIGGGGWNPVYGGLVYAGPGQTPTPGLKALNAANGSLVWSYATNVGGSWVRPGLCVLRYASASVAIAVDPLAGTFLWSYSPPGISDVGIASNAVVIGRGLSTPIWAFDLGGSLLWTYASPTSWASNTAPAISNGEIYVNDEIDGLVWALAPPTATYTPTATATVTPTATTSDTATGTASCTATSSSSSTATPSPTCTATATPTDTASPTASVTSTPTRSGSGTPTATATATPTRTRSATVTHSASSTLTPSGTPSASPSATASVGASGLELDRNAFQPGAGEVVAIRYGLLSPGPLSVSVYDSAGEFVRGLVSQSCDAPCAGVVVWKGTGADGSAVASGVYVVVLVSSRLLIAKKVAVLR